MSTWFRTCPTKISTDGSHVEIWVSKDSPDDPGRSYEVNVCLGKPIDILSLKLNVVKDFGAEVSHHRLTRTSMFVSDKTEKVERCPICRSSTVNSRPHVAIYGGLYHQCSVCSHCFIINVPTPEALEEFYSKDVHFASTYADKRTTETRVRQVAMPKLEWVVERFKSLYEREPKSILDVGAGGGHFVYACKQRGMEAQGIELSEVSIDFCRKTFGFDLEKIDFMKEWKAFSDVDVITFWGVIDCVPRPTDLLDAAHKVLSKREDALVVAEVPRWDSLSTAIQSSFPNSVVRHLDPLNHINCFTDDSLATAFEASGFAPVAAWYFGMDAYELIMQLSHLLGDRRPIDAARKHIPVIQNAIDQARLSDEIILAGKPVARAGGRGARFHPLGVAG